ncbi:hypothetical protein B0A48_04691 [Cryoendolithus antarcticus]|uniref:Uncharacterized protein n=1 Tax=Cryoendolithus antarcticus TaxID=1507870 RepID=A0A1V8TD40_9PEZI|nr:hypothetical protein B0A48_04691 [Cryoendolithus antarcticus]
MSQSRQPAQPTMEELSMRLRQAEEKSLNDAGKIARLERKLVERQIEEPGNAALRLVVLQKDWKIRSLGRDIESQDRDLTHERFQSKLYRRRCERDQESEARLEQRYNKSQAEAHDLFEKLMVARLAERDAKEKWKGASEQYQSVLRMLMILMPVAVAGLGEEGVRTMFEEKGLADNSIFRVMLSAAAERVEASGVRGSEQMVGEGVEAVEETDVMLSRRKIVRQEAGHEERRCSMETLMDILRPSIKSDH